MKKHIGRVANTGQRCVVAYMQIPGRMDHALIIPTDSLNPRLEQAVMEILESQEGQAESDLCRVLERRSIPETGKSVAQVLHDIKAFVPTPVTNVLMLPVPNMPFKLDQLLREMGRLPAATATAPQHAEPVLQDVPPAPPQQFPQTQTDYAQEKYNPHDQNRAANATEASFGIARNLLIDAELLEADAKKKREMAYQYAPSLRPAPQASLNIPTEQASGDAPRKAVRATAPVDPDAPRRKRGRPPKKAAE